MAAFDPPPGSAATRRLGHWLAFGLTALPPSCVAFVVARFAVDIPLQDQWGFAGEVIAYVQGSYSAAQLWLPVGQHRVVMPKLVMLMLAGLTGWDVRAEIWFNFGTALATLALLAAVAHRTLRPLFPAGWPWTLPLMSAALFSLAASQSWTWGWMMAAYLNVLAVAIAAWALDRFAGRYVGIALLVAAATVAALSFISGLVLVVLVPLALLLRPATDQRRVWRACAAAVLLGAIATVYVVTYPRGMLQAAAPTVRLEPAGLVMFTLRYLGSSLGGWEGDVSLAWGVAGLLVFSACALLVWRRAPELRGALLPWLFLATYVVAAGTVTGIGRLASGPGLALASRYTTISGLFWASLPVCVLLAARAVGLARAPFALRAAAGVACAIALGLGVDAYATAWQRGYGGLIGRQNAALEVRGCLRASLDAPDACLRRIFPQPKVVRAASRDLSRLRLSLFREGDDAASREGLPTPDPGS